MRSKKLIKENKDNTIHLTLNDKQYKYLKDISKFYNCNIQTMIRIIIEDVILTDQTKGDIYL